MKYTTKVAALLIALLVAGCTQSKPVPYIASAVIFQDGLVIGGDAVLARDQAECQKLQAELSHLITPKPGLVVLSTCQPATQYSKVELLGQET